MSQKEMDNLIEWILAWLIELDFCREQIKKLTKDEILNFAQHGTSYILPGRKQGDRAR